MEEKFKIVYSERLEAHVILEIQIDDLLVEGLPDGVVEIWYDIQSNENTRRGYIHSNKGGLKFDYDELPSYWTDYPLVDLEYVNSVREFSETKTNLLPQQGMWLAILIIPMIKRIKSHYGTLNVFK